MKTFLKYLISFIVSICLFVASSYVFGRGLETDSTITLILGVVMLVVSFVGCVILLDEVFELHF